MIDELRYDVTLESTTKCSYTKSESSESYEYPQNIKSTPAVRITLHAKSDFRSEHFAPQRRKYIKLQVMQ